MGSGRKSDKQPARVAIVVSRFNGSITRELLRGAVRVLEKEGYGKDRFDTIQVPGAFEIPAAAAALVRSRRYQAIICLGAVIRGETPHFDYISRAVSHTLCQIASTGGIAMGFGILTTETLAQAEERSDPGRLDRGGDAARTALEMQKILSSIEE